MTMAVTRDLGSLRPEAAFAILCRDPRVAWLDSGGPATALSRRSIVAIDPFTVIEARGDRVARDGVVLPLDPFAALERELRAHAPCAASDGFVGGAIGFLGYELAGWLERVPRHPGPTLDVPDMTMGFYDLVAVFDRVTGRATLHSSGLPETDLDRRHRRAVARADWLANRLAAAPPRHANPPALAWHRETPRGRHREMIETIRDHIGAGDIYQANYTNRFRAPGAGRPADIHAALRAASPAPFGAYLAGDGWAIASASPERFLSRSADGLIEGRPIKGTRPRGRTPAEDAALAAALAGSAKDRAENLMIVDLLRNDIGRVAAPATVRVPRLAMLETYPAVHHLVSVVTARQRAGSGAVDLLRAAFPGGSVTGAPKLRAMQIIAATEDAPRGPYCGAMACIGWDGAMDSSILIRTLTVTRETIAAQAGGGIVWDSDPDEEFEEMMTKVRPLLAPFGRAPG